MKITKKPFGTMPDGTAVSCYTIESDTGCTAEMLDYGVTIRALRVPDREGKPVDVILGYDSLEEYRKNGGRFGATMGRFANRIRGAEFEIDGKQFLLPKNEHENHIHGGFTGFDKRVWDAEILENGVAFSRLSPHGEEGFPGNLQAKVTVTWEDTGFVLHYQAESDRDTIVNFTNHSWFNLNGGGDIRKHILQLSADYYTPCDDMHLPTGEERSVAGTFLDFRQPRALEENLRFDGDTPLGFGENVILNGNSPAAVVHSPDSGITMTVTTDQPGCQFYAPYSGRRKQGKDGKFYEGFCGLCLETQHYPDCIHFPQWPSCILRAGEHFSSTTCYRFTAEK